MIASPLTNNDRRLQSDRIIHIFVGTGDDAERFSIQQVLLESISEYFVNAMKNEHLGNESESGVLRFPEDNLEAWQVLLCWVVGRRFPRKAMAGEQELAVSCWVLGDKYGIVEFQDEAMLSLLKTIDTFQAERETIAMAFRGTPPGSKLRLLMTEEMLYNLSATERLGISHQWTLRSSDIDGILNGLNFAGELLEVQQRCTHDQDEFWAAIGNRFEDGSSEQQSKWKEYMVGAEYPDFSKEISGYLSTRVSRA